MAVALSSKTVKYNFPCFLCRKRGNAKSVRPYVVAPGFIDSNEWARCWAKLLNACESSARIANGFADEGTALEQACIWGVQRHKRYRMVAPGGRKKRNSDYTKFTE